jgi:hypothetical protein
MASAIFSGANPSLMVPADGEAALISVITGTFLLWATAFFKLTGTVAVFIGRA